MLTRAEMKNFVVHISVSGDGVQTTPRIPDLEERLEGLREYYDRAQLITYTRTRYPWRFVYTLSGVRLRFPQFAPFGEPSKKLIEAALDEFVMSQSDNSFLEALGFTKEEFEEHKPPC